MSSIVIQAMKYSIMFLFLIYIFESFSVFRYKNQIEKQKSIYRLQKGILYLIHGFGFFSLYLSNPNMEILGFYIIQVVFLSLLFLCFHFIYKKTSIILVHHIAMFFVISMIVLTRLSIESAFRQFCFVIVGTFFMLIIPLFLQKSHLFRELRWLYFGVGVLLLAIVVLLGSTSYGAKLSIDLGFFSFQPSEFVKIIFVFFIASMLYKDSSLKRIIMTSILSSIYVLLLVAAKDLGGALLYFIAYFVLIYIASEQIRYFICGIVGMVFASIFGYILFPHVRVRVFAWLHPLEDIDNLGYQICQSLFGIGTGGWFGLGIGQGLPNKIPVVKKDFIFSAIAEEFGGIFAICFILLCVNCFILFINLAMELKDRFYQLVAIGLGCLYATQLILTIGGAIKFIPSTGVTLPLVSYGGSSVLATCISFGIIQGLYMKRANAHNTNAHNVKVKNNSCFSVVFYVFLSIFAALILYFSYFLIFQSKSFINNEYNSLQLLFEKHVEKGDIITADGYVIAETKVNEQGNTVRYYPYDDLFAHVVGYSKNTKTGLEKQLNFTLLQSNAFFMEQLLCDISGEKKPGDQAITSIRYDLQKIAYDALGKFDGAVIAMEPSTGKILTMVSKPGFNPNCIDKDWDKIQEGTSLYNRCTQGLYAPGSIFKIFTSLAYIKSVPDSYEDYQYECTGEITVDGKTIHCASKKAHGLVNLEDSFVHSCNTSYANLVSSIDESIFNETCNQLLFNQNLPIQFESAKSQFHYDKDSSTALKFDTAIGQGKTLCSPLHMVMVASAICNDGVVFRPNLVERIETYNGVVVENKKPKKYKNILSEEEAKLLAQYMRKTVQSGTAKALDVSKYSAFGKTGTAQTTTDLNKTNAWFVGYAKDDSGKEIAVAIIVENSGSGSKYAVPIAKKIFDAYFIN